MLAEKNKVHFSIYVFPALPCDICYVLSKLMYDL